jgi:hypothetical protein
MASVPVLPLRCRPFADQPYVQLGSHDSYNLTGWNNSLLSAVEISPWTVFALATHPQFAALVNRSKLAFYNFPRQSGGLKVIVGHVSDRQLAGS